MKIAYTILMLALALPLPAAASVVTLDLNDVTVPNGRRSFIDANSDGTFDLYIQDYWSPVSFGSGYTSYITATGANGALVTSGGPIADGALIDGTLGWTYANQLTYKYFHDGTSYSLPTLSRRGDWIASDTTVRGYLGFSMVLADGTHYGWLDMTLDGTNVSVQLHSLGWEDVAGVGINAGSTESLAIPNVPLPASAPLLMGALAGFGALRRRRRVAA